MEKSKQLVNAELEAAGLATVSTPLGLGLETRRAYRCDCTWLPNRQTRLVTRLVILRVMIHAARRDGEVIMQAACLWFSGEEPLLAFLNQTEDHQIFTDRILKVRGRALGLAIIVHLCRIAVPMQACRRTQERTPCGELWWVPRDMCSTMRPTRRSTPMSV